MYQIQISKMSTIVASFYIPRMNATFTRDMVVGMLYHIGLVSRVDFTTINKRPGFIENIGDDLKSAFVHFISLTEYGYKIKNWIENYESYTFYPDSFQPSMYWILLNNTNPIQDTLMNNAQIVENCRFLEEKVQQQDDAIYELQEQVKGLQDVVFKLVIGLYCENTQGKVIDHHLGTLLQETNYKPNKFQDLSKWTIWPTTRQGDDCERRIDELEKQMKKLSINDNYHLEDHFADGDEEYAMEVDDDL